MILVLILSCLPLLWEGTTTDFPELGSTNDPGVVLSGFEYIISLGLHLLRCQLKYISDAGWFYAHAGFRIRLGGDQFCWHMFKGLDYLSIFVYWLSCTFSLTPPLQQQGSVSKRWTTSCNVSFIYRPLKEFVYNNYETASWEDNAE